VEDDGSVTDLIALDRKFEDLRPTLQFKVKVSPSGDIDLSEYCVAMDQGDLESCCGNGTAESLEILENIAHEGITGYQPTLLSRMFIWAMARTENGTLDQDTGTYVRTCFSVLTNLGVCTEILWPYDPTLISVNPSLLAQRQALGHTIEGAYRITSTGDQLLADITTSLSANHPVVFGTTVTTAFQALSGLGPMNPPAPSDTIAGGHCMVVVGRIGGNFLVKNSWGTSWGQGGLCLFTPAYITSSVTNDLWVPTLGPIF
jgi:C1A family cysteine protease